MGYGSIPQAHAPSIQNFYTTYFNPDLNYPRPCAQADLVIDEKGRQRSVYHRDQTPLETLLALPSAAQALRPGLSRAVLERIPALRCDTESAQRMQQAKRKLFTTCQLPPVGPWK